MKRPVQPLLAGLSLVLPGSSHWHESQERGFTKCYRKAGTSIDMIALGEQSAAAMFEQAEKANRMMTWILRAVGFVLILVGFNMLLAPLGAFGDVLPILGRIARFGTGLVSFLLAAPLALVTIAIAWLAVRPLLSVSLLVLAAVIAFGLLRLRKGKEQPQAA